MNYNKKGAMELGISTVVMLVIAIVIIGAGIAFIRGFFGTGTSSLDDAFKTVKFAVEPSRDKPIVLHTGDELNVKAGDKETIGISIYNTEAREVNVVPIITCSGLPTDCNDEGVCTDLEFESIEQKINPGEFQSFPGFLEMPPGSEDYICLLKATDGDFEVSRSFVIKAR